MQSPFLQCFINFNALYTLSVSHSLAHSLKCYICSLKICLLWSLCIDSHSALCLVRQWLAVMPREENAGFSQPLSHQELLPGPSKSGLRCIHAGAIQALMAPASPSGKNGSQETHSLLFTCIKANKSPTSTSKQERRAQILKSTQGPICWVSVPHSGRFFYSAQDGVMCMGPDVQGAARARKKLIPRGGCPCGSVVISTSAISSLDAQP